MADAEDWDATLRAAGRTRRFRRGERLFLEGFRRGSVLVIHCGSVRIVATTPAGDEVTLALRRGGDVIGTHSVLTGDAVAAGVLALEDGEGTVIASDRYLSALRSAPEFMLAEIRGLIEMLHNAEERLIDIATLEVGPRVVRQLARLCGSEAPPVRLPLTQTDLSSMVGAGRGSVAPVLASLRESGTISTSRGQIIVNDPSALV